MEISKATVGVLAVFCLAVGAGGAYLAIRGDAPAPAPTGTQSPVSPAPSASVAQESEAIREEPVVAEDSAQRVSRPPQSPPVEPRAGAPRPGVSREAEAGSVARESAPRLDALPLSTPLPTPPPTPLPTVRMEVQSVAVPVVEPVRPPEPRLIRAVEPPSPDFEELVVSTDSVVGLEMETSITSEGARVEDPVVARVARDCVVDGRVVIPAGAEARGEVTLVERGGRLQDRARLGVRFTLVVLADGTRIPLETETIYREGDARGGESAARIGGGALAGAILGGLFGGTKGAAIGGSAGAGVGTAAVLAGGRSPATLARGTLITVRITAPTTVILKKE